MGISVQEEAASFQGKIGNKSKKKKSDGFELCKEDKRKKKSRKKATFPRGVELTCTHNEDATILDYAGGEGNYEKENMKEKKKKRELEPAEDNDKSNIEMHIGGEESSCLQTDDGKNLGSVREFKTIKEKKGRQDEVVEEHNSSQKDNNADMQNGEEQGQAEKKRKSNKVKKDWNDAGPELKQMEDGFKLSKEDKGKKKDGKKATIPRGVELDGTHNEDATMLDYARGECNYEKEKMKEKKKKRRKLEPAGGNDKSNIEMHRGGEESSFLQTDDGKNLGNDSEFKANKEKKRRQDEVVEEQNSSEKDNSADMQNGEEQGQTEKKKRKSDKGKKDENDVDIKGKKKDTPAEEVEKLRENSNVHVSEKIKKKRKREKRKGEDFRDGNRSGDSTRNKTQEIEAKKGKKGNTKKPNSLETDGEDPERKRKSKRVSFSGHVEVFPCSDGPTEGIEMNKDDGLVRGKRFSPEEDQVIRDSVKNYVLSRGLDEEEGKNMVLHCKSHPSLRGCWKEIGANLPHRPFQAIYYRAHSLFERDERRSWTDDELKMVKEHYEKHGPKWKELAENLGKNRVHLKDTWRRIKLPNMKKGHWSQEEYQDLFKLVNLDLVVKESEEKKSKHGMLRDNISWGAISDKLSTRTDATCCLKWYYQLSSPMVAQGIWADADDYRLLHALSSLDACCVEDVDWDHLLAHRDGDVCRKRWNQMVNHIGEHGTKLFSEQVEILSKRYCPNLLEAREAWDNKPCVA